LGKDNCIHHIRFKLVEAVVAVDLNSPEHLISTGTHPDAAIRESSSRVLPSPTVLNHDTGESDRSNLICGVSTSPTGDQQFRPGDPRALWLLIAARTQPIALAELLQPLLRAVWMWSEEVFKKLGLQIEMDFQLLFLQKSRVFP